MIQNPTHDLQMYKSWSCFENALVQSECCIHFFPFYVSQIIQLSVIPLQLVSSFDASSWPRCHQPGSSEGKRSQRLSLCASVDLIAAKILWRHGPRHQMVCCPSMASFMSTAPENNLPSCFHLYYSIEHFGKGEISCVYKKKKMLQIYLFEWWSLLANCDTRENSDRYMDACGEIWMITAMFVAVCNDNVEGNCTKSSTLDI